MVLAIGLRTKFSLALSLVFLVGIGGAGLISSKVLDENAREEVLHTAEIIMESAMSIRDYTIHEIRPILAEQGKTEFQPQMVPAYAATRHVQAIRERYPEYIYKEAALNPINPAARATEWEASLVEHFRNRPDSTEMIGERNIATGPQLFIARPIQVTDKGCLVCHGSLEDAPESLRARYGDSNGFNWELNEIVGAQIVSVPMSIPLARATGTFWTFIIALSAVFAVLLLILNILLNIVVIRPVKRMSTIAYDVSMGKSNATEFKHRGKDEIASLAGSFNRMQRSLVNAMKMLTESQSTKTPKSSDTPTVKSGGSNLPYH